MDNNSNDTLFGFEAISNMFVEDHSNTTTITPTQIGRASCRERV